MSRAETAVTVKPQDELLSQTCTEIANVLPKKLVDMDEVHKRFPVCRQNSMNTVLTHELNRFNRLLDRILVTLENLR